MLLVIAIQKYALFSTSDFYQTQHKHDIILYLVLEFLFIAALASIHELLYKLSIRFKVPTIVSDLVMLVMYVVLIVFSVLDSENSREMQNDITQDYFITYKSSYNQFGDHIPLRGYVENGDDFGRGIKETLQNAFEASPQHYYSLIGFMVLIGVIALVIVEFTCRHEFKKYTWNDIINPVTEEKTQPNKIYQIIKIAIQGLIIITNIVIISVFCSLPPINNQLSSSAPALYKTFRSFSGPKYKEEYINEQTQLYQQQVMSNGRYIISDQYPMVHGSLNQWCSYNKIECMKQYNFTEEELIPIQIQQPQNQPNVIMIFYESWSPSPLNVNKSIYNYQSENGWYPDQPYNETIFPQLKDITQKSINFLSLATSGLPTVQAWPSLITSEKPNMITFNMIKGVNHETEALPNILKHYNYHTTYVSPAPGDFDGKNYWYSQRDLYDEVHYYAPNDEQLKLLNVADNPKSSWIEDNILLRQAMVALGVDLIDNGRATIDEVAEAYSKYAEINNFTYSKEIILQKQQILHNNAEHKHAEQGQPIMLSLLNVNTHSPFEGNYDPQLGYYNLTFDSKYQRMLQFSQKYISDLINFALELDDNTIFTINGDHGARTNDVNQELQLLQNKCRHKTSGNDQLFTVSGIIGKGDGVQNSLLNEEDLQQYFGKTYIKMFDFDDLQNLLLLSLNISLPTSRVTFFDKNDVLTGKWLQATSNKISTSSTHTILEVRSQDNVYRGSLFGSDNGIYLENVQYPSCLRKGDETDDINDFTKEEKVKMDELYQKGAKQLEVINWYQDNYKFFSRKFIRPECEGSFANCDYFSLQIILENGSNIINKDPDQMIQQIQNNINTKREEQRDQIEKIDKQIEIINNLQQETKKLKKYLLFVQILLCLVVVFYCVINK